MNISLFLSHLLVAECDIGVRFSVRLSVRPSVCQHLCRSSTFMSKLLFLSTTRLNNHQILHEHLPDLVTLRHRCLFFRLSVRSSVRLSTFMSKFHIYFKANILINYKTKQPSDLAGNISLTSWLCEIGVCFSVLLFVHPSVRLSTVLLCRSSTFMSKLVFLSTTRLNNHQTLHETSLWPPDFVT